VLVTGNDNSTEGAKVSFYFNEVADAYAWYEAITEAAPAQAAAVPESSSVSIDFRQATELLEMFGGEPTEITLMAGDGHSGPGLYAVYNADPEGSVHLGETDEEAVPDAPVSQAAAVPEAVEPSEYLRGYMEGKREAAPPAGISPAPLAGNSEAMHAKAFVAYRATDPSVCGFALFMAGWRAALSQGDVSGEGEGS
jgi:hypothetical protein